MRTRDLSLRRCVKHVLFFGGSRAQPVKTLIAQTFLCSFRPFNSTRPSKRLNVCSGSSSTFSGIFLKLKILQEIRKSEEEKLLQLCGGKKEAISITELIRHRKKTSIILVLIKLHYFLDHQESFLGPIFL